MGRRGRLPLAAARRELGWVVPWPGPRERRAGRRACVAASSSAPRWERCGARTVPVCVPEERAGGVREENGSGASNGPCGRGGGGGEAARCSVMVGWGPAGAAGTGTALEAPRDSLRAVSPGKIFERDGRAVGVGGASNGARPRPAFFESPRGGRGSAPFS